MIVCKVRPQKEDPNCTLIMFAGSRICYIGDIGTSTGYLDFVKLMINSVMSCCNARFLCFDENFLTSTPQWIALSMCA